MSSTPDPPVGRDGIIKLPETGEQISFFCVRIEVDTSVSFEIAVQQGGVDEITRSIVLGYFRVPQHFLILPDLVARGSRLLDLGGHIGTFTLYAAALGYEVATVEASDRNAALLRMSLRRNGFDSVRIFEACATERDGTLRFLHAGPYGQVAREGMSGLIGEVPGRRVDGILKELAWPNVAFIKMDIEGSEPAALRGMTGTLSGPAAPLILFESNAHTLNSFGSTPAELIGHLSSVGYRCFEVTEAALVRRSATDPQFNCVTDCLAVKGTDPVLPGRPVRPGYSETELIEIALSAGRSDNHHVRAHVARALRLASKRIRSDDRIEELLAQLRNDSDEQTRSEAGRVAR